MTEFEQIDMSKTTREGTYKWFKSFSNTTYGINAELDITKLLTLSKKRGDSFFINMLYIVTRGVNSIDEMRIRLVGDQPVKYKEVHPGITVMTEAGTYENANLKYYEDYKTFYQEAKKIIDETKRHTQPIKRDYNPKNTWDDVYITCLPWLSFTQMTHPIPDCKSSQSIPRLCWGKYYQNGEKTMITLNITVSHMFVDGYPLSQTFIEIQKLLDEAEKYLI